MRPCVNILAITKNGTNVNLYAYDRAGQLTNEIAFTNGVAGMTTNSWQYDEAGNWLNADGSSRWVYDLDNELVARVPTAAATNLTVTVRGEVEPGPKSNKWYNTWAECRGVSARVNTNDGTFSLPGVPLYPGTNALVVRLRDVSGNEAEQTRTVVRTNTLETFQYDGNGNLTNWVKAGENWAYEWDWADRLTKVTSNGVVVLENWYDANSRRIAKQEVVNGQTVKTLYLYDGWDIVGVMNAQGQLTESYTRGVGLAGVIGTLIAVTHHTGPNAGTYYIHNNHRGDIVLTRSGTTTVSRYDYSAFGNLKFAIGPDLCRFKFSSKELDPSTGLSYYGYRFYAPQWQRWMNRDPIGELAEYNLYAFVLDSPIHRVDALGDVSWGWPIIPPPKCQPNFPHPQSCPKKCLLRHYELAGFPDANACAREYFAELTRSQIWTTVGWAGIEGALACAGASTVALAAVGIALPLAIALQYEIMYETCNECLLWDR